MILSFIGLILIFLGTHNLSSVNGNITGGLLLTFGFCLLFIQYAIWSNKKKSSRINISADYIDQASQLTDHGTAEQDSGGSGGDSCT